ncbi:MAG: hypothetical protein KDB90_09195 [Planctomycetes bacterium]|nr:hypothetical protein [Planctomycetota bacterium]
MNQRVRSEYFPVAFLVSAGLIFLQVSFTRLVGFKLHYHFVFFAVSLALLGLGAAGTFVSVMPRRGTRRRVIFWTAMLALSVAPVYVWLANPLPFIDDQMRLKFMRQVATYYILWVTLPIVWLNFCGGVALTALFSAFPRRMGALYAADLSGAAAGGLTCVLVMKLGSPPLAFLLTAVPAAVACAAVSLPVRRRGGLIAGGAAAAMLAGVMLIPGWAANFATVPFGAEFGSGTGQVDYRWNHVGRVDIAPEGDGLSYYLDGDASTKIVNWNELDPAPRQPDPGYMLVPHPAKVAVIGCGGGTQVADARLQGASRILAIDINQLITSWIKEDDGRLHGGLFGRPVELVTGEGRHELRARGEKFDVIVMHAIDTWSATASGAYALSENFLYTKEAMQDFYACLDEGGVMSIRRWLFQPPRENLRLFITILAALEELGVENPAAHVVMIAPAASLDAVRGRAVWGSLLITHNPVTPAQVEVLQKQLNQRGWSILHAPGVEGNNPFSAYAHSPDREAFVASYPYLVGVVTDADPYIFQFHNPLHGSEETPWGGYDFTSLYDASTILLPVVFGLSLGLSLALILLPLRFMRRRPDADGRLRLSQIIYFACLGVGFMALEIPLVQILSLYLGHPVYGFTIVLVTLLAAAGLGSVLADNTKRSARVFCQLSSLVLLVTAFGVYGFVHWGIAWPGALRFSLAIVLTALAGLPMGFPLALGIRSLGSQGRRAVAWAWGVNGATSVVGSVLVMGTMVFANGRVAFLLGSVAYALAAFSTRWWGKDVEPVTPPSV